MKARQTLAAAAFLQHQHSSPPRHYYFATMPSPDIYSQKQALRKEIRSQLNRLDESTLQEQSQQVWDRITGLPVYQDAKTVGLFLSMPRGEIQTTFIINHAIQHGKKVYVPHVGANFEEADMELLLCPTIPNFYADWPRNKWQIPEPPSELERTVAQPGDLDILLVPGVAFDTQGGRLGHGKGYYDRFLSKMRKDHSTPHLVGVGLQVQLLVDTLIPTTDHDYHMEAVVVPSQVITVEDAK
jgi:5-formyltetrahydrofolate cyclo-ligase